MALSDCTQQPLTRSKNHLVCGCSTPLLPPSFNSYRERFRISVSLMFTHPPPLKFHCCTLGFLFRSVSDSVAFVSVLSVSSVAILRYLCETRDVASHWFPRHVTQRARVDEYLAWQHLNTRLFAAQVFRTVVSFPCFLLSFLFVPYGIHSVGFSCFASKVTVSPYTQPITA